MAPRDQMHLGVYAVGTGNHIAGWRFPEAGKSGEDFSVFKAIAEACERAKLDFLFVGDNLAFLPGGHPGQMLRFEPLTLHSAIAMHTSRIGLIGTATTTYSEPFNLARQFASLDKLSNGRAGWNVVTSSTPEVSANFGSEPPVDHAVRYEMAAEFVEVVRGLWDSWEEGARIADIETGQYYDLSKVHALDHSGRFYSVRGPLNVTRTPQGQPVIVQAGSSTDGQRFASQFAEVMFTVQLVKEDAQQFYGSMKSQVAERGRDPSHCKILPGLMPIVGRDDVDAAQKLSELMRFVDSKNALQTMSVRFGHDMSKYDLDGPVPDLPLSNEIQTYAKVAYAKALKQNLKLRDIYNQIAVARGYMVACGGPETVADLMEEWFADGAADGFVLMPAYFPGALDDFIDLVIPILQQRGLFRREYAGTTLREHLGLPVPTNRHTGAAATAPVA